MSNHPRTLTSRFRPSTWLRAVWVVAIFGACVHASPPGIEYHMRVWTTDDGLPHNSVGSILQDTTGYMWFATAGGLARFDGREFRELRPPQEYGAAGFNIRGMAEERPGVLVVVPASNTLLRLTGATWSVHPANAALAATRDTPRDVFVDSQGSVWVAISRGRILRWEANGQSRVLETGENNQARRLRLAEDEEGMWIVGETLWYAPRKGEMRPVVAVDAEPRRIVGGRGKRTWLLTDQHLYQLAQGRAVARFDLPPQVEPRNVQYVFEDSRGAFWIATTRQGLWQFFEGEFNRVSELLSTSFIAEDREGSMWVSTDGMGVGQLREKSYRLFDTEAGLPPDTVSALSEDATGRVWLATRTGGLISMGPEEKPQPSGMDGPNPFVNVVCADRENRIWFGGGTNGLMRWRPGQKTPEQMPTPMESLHLLFCARNGDMWFASDPHVFGYYRGDNVHLFGAAEGFRPQEVRGIAQDRAGAIWLGGRNGELLRWDGQRFEVFGAARGFPRSPIHAITTDAEDRIWIGTADGLVLKDETGFHVLTEADGLADNLIQQLVTDDRGFIWFAARRGVYYIATAELVAAAHGAPNSRVQSHRIGANQGLVGLSPTANYSPGAIKARDGRIWFATTQGAVAIDPTRVPSDLPKPPVLIDEVRVDENAVATDGALRIPAGRHRVEFKIAVLSYAAPESIVVRHQLEGADPGWVDTGSDRLASYTNLAPGDYRLRVIARNSSGQWNLEGATLGLTVMPAWWETLGFRIGAIVLLIALSAWTARRLAQRRFQARLRRLEQEHALEKERQRIARDLHDDLGASLTELGLMADRLVARGPQEMAPQLSLVAWHTRRLATELSGIVWTMSPRNASLDRMGEFIQQYARRLFHGLPIRCLVKHGAPLPATPLAPDLQHQIIAATREALNNVLKHSKATEVEVDLRCTDDTFIISIADNGRGFSLAAAAHADGNGLRNIRTRAADIGATLNLESNPGSGTRMELAVPLHTAS